LPQAEDFLESSENAGNKEASMNATRKGAVALLACALLLGAQVVQAAGLFAYVAINDGNSVAVIDTASHTVIATLPVGAGPSGVAATPDGRFVYVTNNRGPEFSVSVIDVESNSVIATVPVGPMPSGVATTPDGRLAYALISGAVSAIDTATNTVAATTQFGGNPGSISIAITPDGRFAYIANAFLNTASVLDTATNTVKAAVPVGAAPFDVAVTPDGRFAYTVNLVSIEDALSVIDTTTNTVVASVALEQFSQGIAIHPGGRFAYVTNGLSNTVAVVDLATNSRVAAIPVGANPFRVAVTPDGRFAYVTNQDEASVSVIDTASNVVISTVPVGNFPQGVAFANLAPPDTVAPTTTASAAPPANIAGWNNSPVTLTLSATDNSNGSGVASIAYTVANGTTAAASTTPSATASVVVSAEGVSAVTYRSTDKAGNVEAAKTLTVRIDRIAPASSASRTPAPDASGRNTGPVTVSIVATDAQGGSGVQSIAVLRTNGTSTVGDTFTGTSASVVVSAPGVTSVSYQATDNAGNVEPAKTLTIRIEAAPSSALSAKLTASPSVLWPPDRRFDSIQTRLKTANAVGRVRVTSVVVTSDEPVVGYGDRTSPDWIVNSHGVKLRAERNERGNGRVYTITYTVVDAAGNTAKASDTVTVPKYLHWGHHSYNGHHDHHDDHHDRGRGH
jgi:YVTN family beta-propeller protein